MKATGNHTEKSRPSDTPFVSYRALAQSHLMTHLLSALLDGGLRVAAYYTEEAWYDVGTVSSFEKLDLGIEKHPPSFLVRP